MVRGMVEKGYPPFKKFTIVLDVLLTLVAFLLAAPYFLKIGPLDGVKRPQPEPQGDA